MILPALLLQVATGPTVAAFDRLPPEGAGVVALEGKDHAPIERVEHVPPGPVPPPGLIERDLIERPARNGAACVRKRWRAAFAPSGPDRQAAHVLESVHPVNEIALAKADGCPTGEYVHVNPGLDVATAIDVLKVADPMLTARRSVRFACKDETGGGEFCRSRASILRAIASRTPWVITRADRGFEIWLHGSQPDVITLRFDPRAPDRASIILKYPAPF